MKKIVMTFGLLSGAVSALMMLATVPFMDSIGFDRGAIVGYTAIVVSFLFVYFGIRAYREQTPGGALTFGRAITVGILITLISCACYVATWEVVYFKMRPDFVDMWTQYTIDKTRASGAGEDAVEAKRREMESFKQMYDQPLYNIALTFIEPFPVGLLVTVISAAALRRRGSL